VAAYDGTWRCTETLSHSKEARDVSKEVQDGNKMTSGESPRRADRHRRRNEQSSRRDAHRKKKSRSRRPGTSSDESREERRSHGLSAGALDQLNRENAKPKKKTERPKKTGREDYHEVDQEPRRTRDRNKDRQKERNRDKRKQRVVSGAMMEEGRINSGLRGGRGADRPDEWRWSEQSYEKEDYYRQIRPKKSRKRLCKESESVEPMTLTLSSRDYSWLRCCRHHHHHCCSGCEPKE
jgi:hypothetical protein